MRVVPTPIGKIKEITCRNDKTPSTYANRLAVAGQKIKIKQVKALGFIYVRQEGQ
jgi:16S rRNA C1402 (ribose-2'-O) methylase RsmI